MPVIKTLCKPFDTLMLTAPMLRVGDSGGAHKVSRGSWALWAFWAFCGLALLLAADWAMAADPAPITNVDQIKAAASANKDDAASGFFRQIIGGFWDNPLSMVGSAGGAGGAGLFGPMFAVYNACIFVVGVAWAVYGLGSGIVETANTGKALGQRMSPVWMPIRMVTGIAGIMPVFGGFSLAQVTLVLAATVGIGMANLITGAALNATNSFQTVMSPSAAAALGNSIDMQEIADQMFLISTCVHERQRIEKSSDKPPVDPIKKIVTGPYSTDKFDIYSVYFRPQNSSAVSCGGYTIELDKNAGTTSSKSLGGFRANAVNYSVITSGILNSVHQPSIDGVNSLYDKIEKISNDWHAGRQKDDAKPNDYPTEQIKQAVAEASSVRFAALEQSIAKASQSVSGDGVLTKQAMEEMGKYGFAGIGAWYSTFAETATAMSYAVNSVAVKVRTPGMNEASTYQIMDSVAKSYKASEESKTSDSGSLCSATSKMFGIPVGVPGGGSCSLGQNIVKGAMYGAAAGNGAGGMINPITMSKNIGDYVLTAASTLMVASNLASVAAPNDATDGKIENLAKKGFQKVASAVPGVGKVASFAKYLVELAWLVPYLMILGLLLSIYIPLIPFITWMGGLVQYVIIFCQGMVGMPIAAFAHLDTEGEGLGRRTEAGYMFLLNMAFRPSLMVFGFFFASGLLIVIGSFQAQLFLSAMASAQGNSITGLLSILGYIFVFAVINFSLVQTLFNMIFLLPDQILSMVGGSNIGTDLGKETENKVHGLFLQAGRSTTAMGTTAAKFKADKLDQARKTAAANNGQTNRDAPGRSN